MMRPLELVAEHDFTGVEFDWLAHDMDGHIGLMTTAGAGPVPIASLEDEGLLENVLEQILLLPVICEAQMKVAAAHNIQDWLEVARRGIYAFDWRRETRSYRIIAIPLEPLILGRLGPPLRELAGHVRLQMHFEKDTEFDANVGAWQP